MKNQVTQCFVRIVGKKRNYLFGKIRNRNTAICGVTVSGTHGLMMVAIEAVKERIVLEYIILTADKQPSHKFKHPTQTKRLAEVKDFDNFAVVVPKGYVVLDFDTTSDAERMLEIVEALDLKCRAMKTNRGIHCWFKSSEPMKNFTKARLAIGLYSDCKSGVNGDKRAYVVLKRDGEMREALKNVPLEEIQEIPRWLRPVSSPSNQFNFKGMGDGDGRNQELFNYIVYLQTKGFDRDQIRETIDVINSFVFDDPLPEEELKLIYRDEAFKPEEEIEQQIIQADGFKHNVFGDKLIETFNIITVNEQLYVYEDGYYQQDERIIERKMIEMFPGIRNSQRNEVLSYIRIKTHVNSADLKVNPYIINLKNTRLNVKTGELLPFTPEAVEFDRIPVTYDPSAYSADLDKMLNRVFNGDEEIIQLFDEMVGYMLIKHARYRVGFMLHGGGKNGKSTVLDMLKAFIGERNHTTIELEKLTDRFATAELENKLANIGDDINNVTLKNTGTLKKLFTGESLQVERKGERPFTLKPYAKMIFSMNELPASYDRTEGFYSRLMFIPFKARFTPDDPDFDPDIADKIMTAKSMSYLLNRAVEGAQRLMARGGFLEPKAVKDMKRGYKRMNSIVLSWLDDQYLDLEYILSTPTDQIYADFSDWCKLSGFQGRTIPGKIKFNRELREHYELEDGSVQRWDGGAQNRYFILSLD